MFAPYKLFALIESAREFRVSPGKILRGTGLDLEMLGDPATKTTADQYVMACMNAVRHCDDPNLPFRVGKSIHLSAYGLYGFALLCSPTVRDGFDLAVRYHDLATPLFAIDWQARDDHFIWLFPNEFRVRYPLPLKRFLLAQQLALHITHVQDIARSDRHPLLTKIAHAAPSHARVYEEHLGCPVQFSAEATEIHYDQRLLDERPPLTNPVTLAMLRESCEKLIDRMGDGSSTAGLVTQMIMERSGQFPTMELVAEQMNVTARTLRRRLQEEGTTFSALSDNVRRDLAGKYLSDGDFTVDVIADLLGYADVSSFRQSFRRWTGMTPSGFRNSRSAK